MTRQPQTCCLKVDVDTHDGMRDGVPRLLETFKEFGVRATFFLAFGPDNSGKAIWNIFRRKGFLKKMVRTGAPKLYGWRTVLSGTLLPARPIAAGFPDIVRRIETEGHETAVHAWDHRLWQDHLDRLGENRIRGEFARSFDAYEKALGHRPEAVGAPAWFATASSLRIQDSLGLRYASDMRSGAPCYPVFDGYRSTTLQIPTTQPCLEELLTQGLRDEAECVRRVLTPQPGVETSVIPLHAEVEGGVYNGFLRAMLRVMAESGTHVITMREWASDLSSRNPGPPTVRAARRELPGRSGLVFAPDNNP
ncbi:MAG TPA: polysaccharide deacetylase family protein [Candidatus Brocadiia bacterium]|nr:polysaccharide deacetylase family protein [Candidatus Brocadiia bacterium]